MKPRQPGKTFYTVFLRCQLRQTDTLEDERAAELNFACPSCFSVRGIFFIPTLSGGFDDYNHDEVSKVFIHV
jgi:hypothetical protein